MTDERLPFEDAALFVDDRELHRRINPALPYDRFRAALAIAERDPSFPKVKALWGGRYWPAAKAWFDNDNGVNGNAIEPNAEDGPEHFAETRRKARLQARPASPAVLDRGQRRPQLVRVP